MGALAFGPAHVPSQDDPEEAVAPLEVGDFSACEIDFGRGFWMKPEWGAALRGRRVRRRDPALDPRDVIAIAAAHAWVRPVIDFAHMHATSDGALLDVEPFAAALAAADGVIEPGAPFPDATRTMPEASRCFMSPKMGHTPRMTPRTARRTPTDSAEPFRHEALLYADREGFLAGVLPFIRNGLQRGEPVLVAVDAERIALLRSELGRDAREVEFTDMARLGRNPARLIPCWREFVDARPGARRGIRGIGEPIWPGRSDDALIECHRHESLLNLAFADADGFWLLCPYDTAGLAPEVVEEAHHTHPLLVEEGVARESVEFTGADVGAAPFGPPLPTPPDHADELRFTMSSLGQVRRIAAGHAAGAGLDPERAERFVFALNEIAGNSVRHGGGTGRLRLWQDDESLICEIRDTGRIANPLAGRERPTPGQVGGYGLWLANEACDLVQVRSSGDGSIVRLHMARG